MRKLIWLLLLLPMLAHGAPCPVTVGALTLSVNQPRTSGISPFLAFFDATTTTTTATLGGGKTVPQDVYFAWNFGDSGVSGGSATWGNGANGQTLRNVATGISAAHLYVLPLNATADVSSTVQVWAKVIDASTQAVTIASCTVSITTFAPSGTNGFAGANTVCAFNSALGTGCPAGAGSVTASTTAAAIASLGNGKRVLLKCGDTFTGTLNIPANTTTASVGAYGSCVGTVTGTTAGRPIISSGANDGMILVAGGVGGNDTDVRIADLEVTGDGVSSNLFSTFSAAKTKQITAYNMYGHHFHNGWLWAQVPQSGVIDSTIADISGTAGSFGFQGLFFNSFGDNPSSGNTCFTFSTFCDIRYGAILGNNVSMVGTANTTNAGSEAVRVQACIMCAIENNTLHDSNNIGAVLKHVCGSFTGAFSGQVCTYNVITDNVFTGKSGEFLFEDSTTNSSLDERKQFLLVERNFILSNGQFIAESLFSSPNSTYRNNVHFTTAGRSGAITTFGFQVARRGSENGNSGPTGIEVYNNTCYEQTTLTVCVAFDSVGCCAAPAQSSFAANNLFYNNGAAGTTVSVVNAACPASNCNDTVNNNTANAALNPSMKNGSGNFSLLGDFLPAANASGATSAVPNYFDAFLLAWGTKMQLGALSPAAP